MKTIIVREINGLLLGASLSKECDRILIFEKDGTLGEVGYIGNESVLLSKK